MKNNKLYKKLYFVLCIISFVLFSIKYLLSKGKSTNKNKTDFRKIFSVCVCAALVIFALTTLISPSFNWCITTVDLIDGIIYLLCLSIPLVIICSLDMLINDNKTNYEKKDCILIIFSITINILLPIIYLINTKTLYYKDLQTSIYGNLHSISVWYYYAFAIVPVVLSAIYTIIKTKEIKRK